MRPGVRLVVKYRGKRPWHERIILHSLQPDEHCILTPDGDEYVEGLGDYDKYHDVTGSDHYPPDVR